ncbi:MAG TPA: CheR family methyltransferase [Candidatus Dormibacteraeota bacterium]
MKAFATRSDTQSIEEIEIKLLLEAISLRYGYDFREYELGALRRSISTAMSGEGVATISAYQERVLRDATCMQRLLTTVGVSVTSMFREADTWRCMRQEVFPVLRTYPSVRIWSVGCATGEEVYSLAIALEEEGLYQRSSIYATDMNEDALAIARVGTCTVERLRTYEHDYLLAGGHSSLTTFFTSSGRIGRLKRELLRNVTWAQHNLVTDASFNDFHLIVCRNVLIYFRPALQQRAHDLFYESLVRSGFLALGQRESLVFAPESSRYQPVGDGVSVFRRVQ